MKNGDFQEAFSPNLIKSRQAINFMLQQTENNYPQTAFQLLIFRKSLRCSLTFFVAVINVLMVESFKFHY